MHPRQTIVSDCNVGAGIPAHMVRCIGRTQWRRESAPSPPGLRVAESLRSIEIRLRQTAVLRASFYGSRRIHLTKTHQCLSPFKQHGPESRPEKGSWCSRHKASPDRSRFRALRTEAFESQPTRQAHRSRGSPVPADAVGSSATVTVSAAESVVFGQLNRGQAARIIPVCVQTTRIRTQPGRPLNRRRGRAQRRARASCGPRYCGTTSKIRNLGSSSECVPRRRS